MHREGFAFRSFDSAPTTGSLQPGARREHTAGTDSRDMHLCSTGISKNPQPKVLMTQPGVGPNTALAFVLTVGDVGRFRRDKQVASYVGLIPREESSGERQKLVRLPRPCLRSCRGSSLR